MKLYSAKTGEATQVPEADAVAALQSGDYVLPAGSMVPIQHESGEAAEVPIEQLQEHLDKGAGIISRDQLEEAQLQKDYGGFAGQATAAVAGALEGPTLGLTTDLAASLSPELGKYIEKSERANPGTHAAAQIVGTGLSMLGGDEAGAAGLADEVSSVGRALSAPTRALGRAGSAVEGFLKEAMGASEEDSFITALAKNVAAKGASGAVEGAGLGYTQHITEEQLGDPNANGESLLAATGHGALLGFGTGAVLGAGGQVARSVLGKLSPRMRTMAEAQAAKATGAVKELESLPGGAQAAGRRLLDDGVIGMGDTVEGLAPKVAKAAKAADARVAEVLETADKAGQWGPDVEAMFTRAAKNPKATAALEAMTGIPSAEEAAAKGLDRAAMISGATLSFKDALSLAAAPALRGVWSEEIGTAAEQAAKALGGSSLAAYRDAKLAVDQYAVIGAALEKRAAKLAETGTPGVVSPGAMWGAGMAALHGNIPAAATIAAGSAARHFAAERGAATSAYILDKLSALHGIERSVKSVDRQVARGLSGIFRPGERAAVGVREVEHAVGADVYAERVAAVQKAAQNPEAAAQTAMESLAPHAPATAKAFTQSAIRATNYLASLIPKSKRPPSITPQFDRPHVANALEQASFNRAFNVVHDPMTVLEAVRDGRLTRDHVKAIAQVYPALYARVVQGAEAELADLKHPLTAAQKQQLGILIGKQPDVELTRRLQQTYAMAQMEPPKPEQAQGKQHGNERSAAAPRRPITATAKNTALNVGRPQGS